MCGRGIGSGNKILGAIVDLHKVIRNTEKSCGPFTPKVLPRARVAGPEGLCPGGES